MMRLYLMAAAVFASLFPCATFGQQKRVYLAPDDHTDYFWSADDVQYRQAFLDTLDYYLELADATAGNPSSQQSRWNCDGHLWLWTYQQNRTAAEFQRLIDRINDGHISAPLNALCVCLGAAPAEAVLRGMYYPGQLEREYGIDFKLAYMIENQTQPLGLTSLWAGSGARYSWKGICNCDTQVSNAWDREHDIYRAQGPDGAEVLLKWNSMLFGNENMGGYAEARFPAAVVDTVTSNAPFNGFASRYPYDVIGCFGKGWDDFQTQTSEFVSVAQSASNASRQVIVSNELDFFADFESTYNTASLPAKAVSFGNEWELYSAGMAEVSARAKRAIEKLRTAEAMAAIVSRIRPDFMDGRETARDQAYMNWGLFWEHDFGMVGPPTGSNGVQKRITWQHNITTNIENYVNLLYADAATALTELVPTAGDNPRFYVFNPLGWTRSDVADLPYTGPTPIHVVDASTNAEIPSQMVTIGGQTYLRVLADGIPSVGYRVFEIRSGAGTSLGDAAAVSGGAGNPMTMDHPHYRVTVEPRGAISSILDHTRSDREFVQTIGGRVMNDLGASTGTVVAENAGPVSVTLKAVASSPVAHTTRVTVYRNLDRIDIENQITQNFGSTQTYAFGCNLTSPFVRHEEVGAILRAKLSTNGGDYSPRNARYDWLTLNHFADISGDGVVGLTLSNADSLFFRLGNSTTTTLDTTTPSITALAGGNVANGNNGIANQGGDSSFTHHFAIRTHGAYDQAAAMRMSLEHQNPLAARMISGADPHLPADQFSAIQVSNASVLLWSYKPADSGPTDGIIARLWNLDESPRATVVQLSPSPIATAFITSHIETDQSQTGVTAAGISESFQRQQIRTFRLVSGLCGDIDGDGDRDAADMSVFVAVLTGIDANAAHAQASDFNADSSADGADIAGFTQCLLMN